MVYQLSLSWLFGLSCVGFVRLGFRVSAGLHATFDSLLESEDLTPGGTAHLCERIECRLQEVTRQRQRASYRRWKERLRHSALHTGKAKAATTSSPNLLAGQDGLPAYHPANALKHAAQQWNTVFAVHADGIPVEPLMRPIQHLLERRATRLDLPAALGVWTLLLALMAGPSGSPACCRSLPHSSTRWRRACGPCLVSSALPDWRCWTRERAPAPSLNVSSLSFPSPTLRGPRLGSVLPLRGNALCR